MNSGRFRASRARRRRGAALIFVLIVLSVMVMITMANSVMLDGLRKFLDRTERQQIEAQTVNASTAKEK